MDFKRIIDEIVLFFDEVIYKIKQYLAYFEEHWAFEDDVNPWDNTTVA